MGRIKKGESGERVIVIPPASEAETQAESPEQAEAAADIAGIAEETGRKAEARVYRVNESQGTEDYICKVAPAMVNNEFFAREFGGGLYKIVIRKPKPTGGLQYDSTRELRIDKNIPSRSPSWMVPEAGAAAALDPFAALKGGGVVNPQDIMGMGMMAVLKQMMDNSAMVAAQSKEHGAAMLELMKREGNGGQSGAFLAVFTALAPVLPELIRAFTNRKDPAEIAAGLIEKVKASEGGKQGIKELLETMMTLREAADSFRPPEKEEDSALGLIGRFAPKVLDILDNATKQQLRKLPAGEQAAAERTLARDLPITPDRPASPSAPQQPAEVDMGEWAILDSVSPRIAEAAQAGEDAEDFGYSMAGMIPVLFRGRAREMIIKDGVEEAVMQRYPALAQYPSWVAAFVHGVRGRLAPELFESSADEGKGGGGGDEGDDDE